MDREERPADGPAVPQLAITGFTLNLAWEFAQWPFYHCGEQKPSRRVPMIFGAAVADGAIILGLYAWGSRIFSDRCWTQAMDGRKVLFSVGAGMLVGVSIEKVALSCRWWEYHERMPLLPRLGVGLLPVIQMTFLPLLTFCLVGDDGPQEG